MLVEGGTLASDSAIDGETSSFGEVEEMAWTIGGGCGGWDGWGGCGTWGGCGGWAVDGCRKLCVEEADPTGACSADGSTTPPGGVR